MALLPVRPCVLVRLKLLLAAWGGGVVMPWLALEPSASTALLTDDKDHAACSCAARKKMLAASVVVLPVTK